MLVIVDGFGEGDAVGVGVVTWGVGVGVISMIVPALYEVVGVLITT